MFCNADIDPRCQKKPICKGLCDGHYTRLKRGLNINVQLRPPSSGAKIQHGGCGTRLYRIWANLKQRCTNPNHPYYHLYGGKGVTLYPDWEEFFGFQSWAIDNGYNNKFSINRVNNNGPYSPDNCEWATQSQQMRNTGRSRLLTVWEETKTMVEWSEDPRCVVSYYVLRSRLRYGYAPEEAITLPKMKGKVNE